ncbi:tRNA1(Val) (adenine(37)-N6)-methyltransferase [Luteolibacter luteus]|uniref:Methyltransferase n=1 Tax=Luteolibacter luteus TaxID=2728835 RepID=A0A858RP74_9BACT|nr:methyltransferase [Luteolibacter luteus]QJE97930.1 methyltransferase [Luteolibacter luteus]
MNSFLPDQASSAQGSDAWQEERARLEAELGERITLDALTGPVGLQGREPSRDDAGGEAGWMIAQRKRGHRHSIDDVLTAWYALQVSPPVTEHLDLGTGIGTVGLLTLWGMGEGARLTCVEAQEISYRLLQSNLDANGLRPRVDCSHGDLRDLCLDRKFPLITGSPPYFPTSAGVVPQDSQKAHARFELRGDVSDYAKAAVKHLAPGGWFVLCFPTPQKQRALDGIAAAGLKSVKIRDVIPRETLEPLFTLFACRHADDVTSEMEIEEPLTVRERSGRLTAAMAAVRRCFGFRDGEAHGGHAPVSA